MNNGIDRPVDRRLVLVAATVGSFLTPFISSSVNIALPAIQRDFNASAITLSWLATSYILASAALLVPFGKLSDLYGWKRVFLWGSLIFSVSSLASAVAPSVGLLIAFRVIQGAGSAMIFATATAMVTAVYPPWERGRALGVLVAAVYLGLSLGPGLGGLLTDNLSWRSVFVVSAGFGMATALLTKWKLSHVEWLRQGPPGFDRIGSVAYALALTALMLGFSWLPSWAGAALLGAGAAGLIAFVWWETRVENPVLDVNLFRGNRLFALSNAAALVNYSATFAIAFLMSLYLQYIKGLTAETAGLILITQSAVQAAFSPVAGRLSDRIECRVVASTGMALCVVGLSLLAFLSSSTPLYQLVLVLGLLGLGFALFSSPNISTVMGCVEPGCLGVASATLAAMRLTGQSLSMGIASMVIAIVVGRGVKLAPAVYPQFVTSVRVSFAIFAGLCLLGVLASLTRGSSLCQVEVAPECREIPPTAAPF